MLIARFRAAAMNAEMLRLPTLLAVLLLAAFFSFAAFFALNLKRESIIPDEGTHLAFSEYFSSSWGIPPDSPETYQHGVIAHRPNLYYWINGRLHNLLYWLFAEPGNWKILITQRLSSVVYATLAVLFVYLLAREVIENPWWQLLVVFLLTNTLMFVFIAGGVSYDNLTNLTSFAGIYFLVRLLKGKDFYRNSLAWMTCILTGTLVKVTVLPLLAVMAFVWLAYTYTRRREIDFRPRWNWKTTSLLAMFIILSAANAALYGLNLIQYQAVTPDCTQILTESQCEQNAIYIRNKEGANNFRVIDLFNGNVPDPFTWFVTFWFPSMIKMIYGIMGGGRTLFPSTVFTLLFSLWYIGMLITAIGQRRETTLPVLGLSAIVLFYVLTLLQTNISSELQTGFKHYAIQGRYFFPAIGALYVVFGFYAAKIPNKVLAWGVAGATVLLFFFNSPLWVLNYPAALHFPTTRLMPEESAVTLSDGAQISQVFRSECSGTITQVDLLVSGQNLAPGSAVNLQLTDLASQQVIAQQTAGRIPAQSQVWLAFPLSPVPATMYQEFRFTLSASGIASETPLAVWNTTTNVYRGGDTIIGGIGTNMDLIFRYTCRMPALTEWFIP